ncbi:MAG: NUDIX hydrolase [Candidatus Omnitrophota bacterium]
MKKGKFKYKICSKKLPNGLTRQFRMIDHPGAVLIVPFMDNRNIILLRQYRPALGKYLFELPCGTIDPNESPLVCAKRELIEETGYKGGQFSGLGKIYPAPGYTNEVIYLYQAQQLMPQHAEKDQDEIISTRIVSRPEIKSMVAHRKISDAKTICALVFCGWL